MACAADAKALQAAADVRTELVEPTELVWCPFEALLAAVTPATEVTDWATAFRQRYLDFSPVHSVLPDGDPTPLSTTGERAQERLRSALVDARAIADRVLGGGSVLE